MNVELLVRFANEGHYYNNINISPEKIKDVMVFPKEVFFTIDDVRVACDREDWDRIQEKLIEKNN